MGKNSTGAHHSVLCDSKVTENKTGLRIGNGASTHANTLLGSSISRSRQLIIPITSVGLEISRISHEHVELVKKVFSHLRDLWFFDVCRTKEA